MTDIDHTIFDGFRKSCPPKNEYIRNIVDVKNNLFYLFDVSTGSILVTCCSSFLHSGFPQRYQVFKPNVRIFGDVEFVRASENNVRIAIATKVGLYVVELPNVWISLMTPTSCYRCSVWILQPEVRRLHRFFLYEVLQARWNPHTYHHLLVLYNDNIMRLVDADTKTTIKTLALGRHPDNLYSTVNALHENAIDFDFLPPKQLASDKEYENIFYYPVILLYGNGDVRTATITDWTAKLLEPVAVCPDNEVAYHVPYCSITVLHGFVVIMANMSGQIFHCVLLGSQEKEYLQIVEVLNFYNKPCEIPHTPSRIPLILISDTGSAYRYFILHAAGIHAVMLPSIPIFEKLLTVSSSNEPDKLEIMKALASASRESECVSRYLVCTTIGEPVYGLGVITGKTLSCRIIVLLANSEAMSIIVDAAFQSPNTSISDEELPEIDFQEIVSDYLLGSESSRLPVFKGVKELENKPMEEKLEVLLSYMNDLWKNKIVKHEFVVSLIEERKEALKYEYNIQLKTIEMMKDDKEILKRNAERIAEKYEESNDKHVELMKRIEMIGVKLSMPSKSVVEEKNEGEVAILKKRADELQVGLQKVTALLEFKNYQELNSKRKKPIPKTVYIDETRRKIIKDVLVKQSESIKELSDRLKILNLKSQATYEEGS